MDGEFVAGRQQRKEGIKKCCWHTAGWITHSPNSHTAFVFQHASAGPIFIFGLAMACADQNKPRWRMRGPRGPGAEL